MNDYSSYRRQEILQKVQGAGFRSLDVMVTGVTGAGKSTTLNSLFKKTISEVGSGTNPMTMELDSYSLSDAVRFWDTPGLGDGVSRDAQHSRKLIDLLGKTYSFDGGQNVYGFIDLALIIIDGSTRDMGIVYRLINDIVIPNIQHDRVIVAINQADIKNLIKAVASSEYDNMNSSNNKLLLSNVVADMERDAENAQANKLAVAQAKEILKELDSFKTA